MICSCNPYSHHHYEGLDDYLSVKVGEAELSEGMTTNMPAMRGTALGVLVLWYFSALVAALGALVTDVPAFW